jgi:hypothetical protein
MFIPHAKAPEFSLKPDRDVAQALVKTLPDSYLIDHRLLWLWPERTNRGRALDLSEGKDAGIPGAKVNGRRRRPDGTSFLPGRPGNMPGYALVGKERLAGVVDLAEFLLGQQVVETGVARSAEGEPPRLHLLPGVTLAKAGLVVHRPGDQVMERQGLVPAAQLATAAGLVHGTEHPVDWLRPFRLLIRRNKNNTQNL